MDTSHAGKHQLSPDDRQVIRLADLCGAWTTDATGAAHPDWVRLRAFADLMNAHPDLVSGAIAAEPAPSGWLVLDVLLAAVAEKLADDTGIPRPAWCANRPVLSEPWSAPTRPTKHVEASVSAPSQCARRGLLIPATAIWRNRAGTVKPPAA